MLNSSEQLLVANGLQLPAFITLKDTLLKCMLWVRRNMPIKDLPYTQNMS